MKNLTPVGTNTPHHFIPSIETIADFRPDLANKCREKDDLVFPDLVPGELSSEFAMLDPALSELHHDMQAAAVLLAEAKRSGKKIDVALWHYETAESAYQTRLFEVRKNKLASAAATAKSEDCEAKCQLHKLTMQQKMNEDFALLRQKRAEAKRRKEEQSSGGWLFYMMLGMWFAQMNAQKHDQAFGITNRMMMDFTAARRA